MNDAHTCHRTSTRSRSRRPIPSTMGAGPPRRVEGWISTASKAAARMARWRTTGSGGQDSRRSTGTGVGAASPIASWAASSLASSGSRAASHSARVIRPWPKSSARARRVVLDPRHVRQSSERRANSESHSLGGEPAAREACGKGPSQPRDRVRLPARKPGTLSALRNRGSVSARSRADELLHECPTSPRRQATLAVRPFTPRNGMVGGDAGSISQSGRRMPGGPPS